MNHRERQWISPRIRPSGCAQAVNRKVPDTTDVRYLPHSPSTQRGGGSSVGNRITLRRYGRRSGLGLLDRLEAMALETSAINSSSSRRLTQTGSWR